MRAGALRRRTRSERHSEMHAALHRAGDDSPGEVRDFGTPSARFCISVAVSPCSVSSEPLESLDGLMKWHL